MQEYLRRTLAETKEAGLYKEERLIKSAQRTAITVEGKGVLNFYASNYLGLSSHPRLIRASQKMMNNHGCRTSSVRFTYGTQDMHRELKAVISDYFQTEDMILYAACFDANDDVFEPLFSEKDTIIPGSLSHAPIIDGVHLCRVKRYRYTSADMEDLGKYLQEAQAQRFRIVVMDSVFSVDDSAAPMNQIYDLTEKYDALVMVSESRSVDVVSTTDYGVSGLYRTYGHVGIYTGTLGKAFGGALRGFTARRKEIIDLLRQCSRPYLFPNSLAPGIIGASPEVFRMLKESNALHDELAENVNYFRDKMITAGFDIEPTQDAICAVMLYDARLPQIYVARMQEEGVYVTDFYYPAVPKDQARIHIQISVGHEKTHLGKYVAAFIKVSRELNVLKVE